MKHRAIAAIAAATLIAAPPAWAGTAGATLSDLQIRLVDLDANDGIAPSVVFQDEQGGTFIGAESGTSWQHVTDAHWSGAPFGGASASAARGAGSASAKMSGDPFGAGADVAVSATAVAHGTYSAGSVWLGDGGMYMPFTLSPATRLVITGDVSASAMSTLDDPAEDTWASAFLELTDYTGLNDVSAGGAQAEQFSTGGAAPFPVTDARHIEISFDNPGATSAGGIFAGSIDASASSLDPVPEPAGFVLFGVGALGLLASRRRPSR